MYFAVARIIITGSFILNISFILTFVSSGIEKGIRVFIKQVTLQDISVCSY